MTAPAKVDNAVEKTKRVAGKTLEHRRGARPKPQEVGRARGAAVAWSRRCRAVVWDAVSRLEGEVVDGEMVTRGKVRGLRVLVDALFAHHRKEVEHTAQFPCAIATHFHDMPGERGLCSLARYGEATVSAYLQLLARARIILYKPGRCGELSLVGFPYLYEGSERARMWCGARLMVVAGDNTKAGREVSSWWQPMLQAMVDGSSADQAASLFARYREAYEQRERARKEDTHMAVQENIRKGARKGKRSERQDASAVKAELRGIPTADLQPEMQQLDAQWAAKLQAKLQPAAPAPPKRQQTTEAELQRMVERTRIDQLIAAAPPRRQPPDPYPQFLGDNSRRGIHSNPSRPNEGENERPQRAPTLRSAPLSPSSSLSLPTKPLTVAPSTSPPSASRLSEGKLDRGRVRIDPPPVAAPRAPEVLGPRPSPVEAMLRAGGVLDEQRDELQRIENQLERERAGAVVLAFPPKGGAP